MNIDTTLSPLFPHNSTTTATHVVYLALGSNVGDRRGYLATAIQQLREVVDIFQISSLYETKPVGYTDQADFFDLVLCGKTSLTPDELLHFIKAVEVAVGREPTFRNGPRQIDIDILFYDDAKVKHDNLEIPHPRLQERAFVLTPLAEIAPQVIDPVSGHTAEELQQYVSQDGIKKIANNLHIPLQRDIQSSRPKVQVRLGRAGVVGVKKSLVIGDAEQQQRFDATFDLYANLDTKRAGVHMSRFRDVLEEVLEEYASTNWPRIELLAEAVATAILERQQVSRAEVRIHTSLPIAKWTPVSGRRTQEVYGLLAHAVATTRGVRRMVGVEVEGMVACPCAQDMVHAYTRTRLLEEGFEEDVIEKVLNVTPLATHNQRGIATLMIGTEQEIDARDLVTLVEGAMSSENYSLLKRPDELFIVNKAHSNPRFVEDVVREVLQAVVNTYTELPDDSFVWVHERNEETIHKYDVEAEGWGTLGELRAELLHNQALEYHTGKESWLYDIH